MTAVLGIDLASARWSPTPGQVPYRSAARRVHIVRTGEGVAWPMSQSWASESHG